LSSVWRVFIKRTIWVLAILSGVRRICRSSGGANKLTKQIALSDGKLFQQLTIDHQQIEKQKEALESNRQEVARQAEAQKQKLVPLEKKLAEKKGLLTAVRRRKKFTCRR